jgi:tetratricopeptide (TPR) repeat protein
MARGRFVRTIGIRGAAAAVLFGIVGFAAPGAAQDDGTVKATLTGTINDGYARLIFETSDFDDATVRLANNVLIVTFKRPVDIGVDRIATQIPDYIGAARRDPDGFAVRMALAQQVTMNATPAGEKLFVDLLPTSWSGAPPSLPQEVIADLARRARLAEQFEQKERKANAQQRQQAMAVRVHVATQPTFTRYVFAVPQATSVSFDRAKNKLTLGFDAPIKFDLADALAALPRTIGGIETETRNDSALVRFTLLAKLDVRTFRDSGGYVLDIVGADGAPDPESAAQAPPAAVPGVPAVPSVAPQQSAAPEGAPPATIPPAAGTPPSAAAPAEQHGAAETPAPAAIADNPKVAVPVTIAAPAQPAAAPDKPAAQEQSAAPDRPAAPSAATQPTAPAVADAQPTPPAPAPAPAPSAPTTPTIAAAQPAPTALSGPATGKPPEIAPEVAAKNAAPEPPAASAPTTDKAAEIAPKVEAAPKAEAAPKVEANIAPAEPPLASAETAKAPPPAPASQSTAAAPEPAVPEKAAPEKAAPESAAQQTPPSEKTAPEKAAPEKAAPEKAAPEKAEKTAPSPAPVRTADNNEKIEVELARQGSDLKLTFPFKTSTAGAVFNRADTLWIVFDSKAVIDLSALDGESSHTVRSAEFTRTADADIIRIKLDHPHLSTVDSNGTMWTVQIGDSAIDTMRGLDITRNLIGPNRSSVTIAFDAPHVMHRLDDPEAGDALMVVTAFPPARGFLKTRDFVEFRALASAAGVAIEPLADDVKVELAPDKVVVSRPMGLALSTSLQTLLRGSGLRPVVFDSQLWGFDQQASYAERQSRLIAAAAGAPDAKRLAPRLDLARFYVARDMYPEAKGVLDVALNDERSASEHGPAIVLRAVAEIMMNRPDDALKDLSDPTVGDQHDAALWRALAYAKQGKWAQARDGFRTADAAVATLPVELQRVALKEEMRADIEVGDFSGASNQLNDFETIGVPHDLEPAMAVLVGRLAEGMGRTDDALAAYQTAADSWDRRAAAQGQLRETLLRYAAGDLSRDNVISQLETLTTIWRGDETEIEALQILARLYTAEGRYRDSFYVMRSAMAAHPNSDMTRRIQQEAAATFDALFLAGKGDGMPAIEALALFYDFRELTPIGRRGDEMIRRLVDRLVSVDLLDQAADLLQYQVDNRLQGAARAQVATRLAVIYLMNHKDDRALAVLRATRSNDLTNELRNQRLLLEARALSDMHRHDLALEVIGNVDGREAIRLRSDIYWAVKRWREAGEQLELLYGERWKDFAPLNDMERADIVRAELGYALGEDKLGQGRLREKYAAKMAGTPDAHAFDVVSAPLGTSGNEFAAIAHAAAAVDTLDGFLRDMQARYPDSGAAPPDAPPQAAAPGGPAEPPALPPAPPPRAAGRSAQR